MVTSTLIATLGVTLIVSAALVGAAAAWWLAAFLSARIVRRMLEKDSAPRRWPLYLTPASYNLIKEVHRKLDDIKREARDNAERYQILTDNIAAGIIIHDPEGEITWCSPFLEVLTGYSRKEIIEKRSTFLSDITLEEDRELLKRALAVAGIGEPFQFRFRYFHKSGLTMWAETRTVPIFDDEAGRYMALSILLDVTREVTSRLSIEQKNRDMHDFTYMVSHDLKAPLSTIKGMAGILAEENTGQQTETGKEAIQHIQKAAARLDNLVSGILELAQVSASERNQQAVPLNEVISEAMVDLKTHIDSCNATIEIEDKLPSVLGDKAFLYRIFSNLLSNSIKYRSSERPLKITVRAVPGTSRRQTKIIFADNGIGIDDEQLPVIFRPFKRAYSGDMEGTGVGLASVQKLVERLGGSISVESVKDDGSRFLIELKIADSYSSH